jgi:hypothetical protein
MFYFAVVAVVMLQNVGISYIQKFDVVLVVVVLLGLCREEVPEDVTDNSELNPITLVIIDLAESLVGSERKLGVRCPDDVDNFTVVIFRIPMTMFKSQITQEVEKSDDSFMGFAEVSVESQYNRLIRHWLVATGNLPAVL